MINIDELIQQTLKTLSDRKVQEDPDDVIKLNNTLKTYRNIKAAFTTYVTAKDAKELTEAAQLTIIKKMVSQNEESLSAFKKAGRDDLICETLAEIGILKTFLPDVPDMPKIEKCYLVWRGKYESETEFPKLSKKEMGVAIKAIKEDLPMADGKMVSDVVKKYVV